MVINEEGIVQYTNSKALEMLGYKTEQLIGQNVRIICPGMLLVGACSRECVIDTRVVLLLFLHVRACVHIM